MLRNAPKLERNIPLTEQEIETVKVHIQNRSDTYSQPIIVEVSSAEIKKLAKSHGIRKIRPSARAFNGIKNIRILSEGKVISVKPTNVPKKKFSQ